MLVCYLFLSLPLSIYKCVCDQFSSVLPFHSICFSISGDFRSPIKWALSLIPFHLSLSLHLFDRFSVRVIFVSPLELRETRRVIWLSSRMLLLCYSLSRISIRCRSSFSSCPIMIFIIHTVINLSERKLKRTFKGRSSQASSSLFFAPFPSCHHFLFPFLLLLLHPKHYSILSRSILTVHSYLVPNMSTRKERENVSKRKNRNGNVCVTVSLVNRSQVECSRKKKRRSRMISSSWSSLIWYAEFWKSSVYPQIGSNKFLSLSLDISHQMFVTCQTGKGSWRRRTISRKLWRNHFIRNSWYLF